MRHLPFLSFALSYVRRASYCVNCVTATTKNKRENSRKCEFNLRTIPRRQGESPLPPRATKTPARLLHPRRPDHRAATRAISISEVPTTRVLTGRQGAGASEATEPTGQDEEQPGAGREPRRVRSAYSTAIVFCLSSRRVSMRATPVARVGPEYTKIKRTCLHRRA